MKSSQFVIFYLIRRVNGENGNSLLCSSYWTVCVSTADSARRIRNPSCWPALRDAYPTCGRRSRPDTQQFVFPGRLGEEPSLLLEPFSTEKAPPIGTAVSWGHIFAWERPFQWDALSHGTPLPTRTPFPWGRHFPRERRSHGDAPSYGTKFRMRQSAINLWELIFTSETPITW